MGDAKGGREMKEEEGKKGARGGESWDVKVVLPNVCCVHSDETRSVRRGRRRLCFGHEASSPDGQVRPRVSGGCQAADSGAAGAGGSQMLSLSLSACACVSCLRFGWARRSSCVAPICACVRGPAWRGAVGGWVLPALWVASPLCVCVRLSRANAGEGKTSRRVVVVAPQQGCLAPRGAAASWVLEMALMARGGARQIGPAKVRALTPQSGAIRRSSSSPFTCPGTMPIS